MALELRHLRYFIAVAEEGHITRAAERLGMQQPPLSQRIKAIERDLGVQLFHRKPRGVELTAAGRAFFDDARAILAHLDRALDRARRTARGNEGRLCVGYTSVAVMHPLVWRTIREFRKAFSSVSLTLAEGVADDLVERVRNGQVDIAFVRRRFASPDGVAVESLLEEASIVALPSGHALARRKDRTDRGLPLTALAGETFIVFGDAQSGLTAQSNILVAACQRAGFSPRIDVVASHTLSKLNLVGSGAGIAVVAASMRRMRIDGIVYRRLRGSPQLRSPLHLVSRRDDISPVVRQFRSFAKRTARNDRPDFRKA